MATKRKTKRGPELLDNAALAEEARRDRVAAFLRDVPEAAPRAPVSMAPKAVPASQASPETPEEKVARLSRYGIPIGTGPVPPAVAAAFRVGDTVSHPLFGAGRVTQTFDAEAFFRPNPFGPLGRHIVPWVRFSRTATVRGGEVDTFYDAPMFECSLVERESKEEGR